MINGKQIATLVLLVVMAAFGFYWRTHHVKLPPESEMPQIMKEAAGTAPLPASDTPGRKAIRESFKYLLDENRNYQTEADRFFLRGHLSYLMHPGSFVRPGEPEAIIGELRQLKELDQKHLTDMQHFPEVFKEKLSAAGASAGDVDALERVMTKEISGGALNDFTQGMELDMKWIDALIDVYQYAGENQSHISVRGAAQLEFDSDDIRSQFVYLSDKVKDLGEQRDRAQVTFNSQQQRNRRRMGFTAQDVGRADGN